MPTTIFAPTNGCINQPVQFTDNSTNPVSGVGQWKWFFGDGDSSVLQNPVHTYINYGNYTAQLQVASPHGCAAAAVTQPVVIDSKPVAAFDFQFPALISQQFLPIILLTILVQWLTTGSLEITAVLLLQIHYISI